VDAEENDESDDEQFDDSVRPVSPDLQFPDKKTVGARPAGDPEVGIVGDADPPCPELYGRTLR
jgi:hypothetical protein